MPAWIALEAIRQQLWMDYVSVKGGQEINPDLMAYMAGFNPTDEMVTEFNRLVMGYREMAEADAKRLLHEIGIEYIEAHMENSRGVSIGVEVVFESVIREAWTAFEDLARELWVVTLNNDDGTIATRVTLSNVLRKISKRVQPTFNQKTHPGSFQVETRQAVFQRLNDIEALYTAAFGPTAKSLFDTIEAGYIRVLYAFRNLLVHKRGKSDQEFLDQIAAYPEFSSIKKNDIIEPKGSDVRRMRDSAMLLGRKLIQLADTELQKQKP